MEETFAERDDAEDSDDAIRFVSTEAFALRHAVGQGASRQNETVDLVVCQAGIAQCLERGQRKTRLHHANEVMIVAKALAAERLLEPLEQWANGQSALNFTAGCPTGQMEPATMVMDFRNEAAIHYAGIRADLKRRGAMIGANDLFVAAHARSLGLVLVTNNTREFGRVTGLTLQNWTLTSSAVSRQTKGPKAPKPKA